MHFIAYALWGSLYKYFLTSNLNIELMQSFTLASDAHTLNITLSSLSVGMYYIEVLENGRSLWATKLMKQ